MSTGLLLALLSAAGAEEPDPRRLEAGGLPVLAYDSDLGLQLGFLVALARFDPAYAPYRWRLEVLLSATIKQEADGSYAVPFHDDYVRLDLPGLLEDRLRLAGEAHWGRYADSAWYGPGSASTNVPPPGGGDRYFLYERTYPRLELGARGLLWKAVGRRARLELIGGASLIYNDLAFEPTSSLARDVAAAGGSGPDAETLRAILHGVGDHVFGVVKLGISLDTRDRELNPSCGSYAELSLRGDTSYAGLYAVAIGFVPLRRDDLILAARGVLDIMAGDPPFYALTEAGAVAPTTAVGGGSSVRGVPGQRYGGKIKTYANLELRAQLPRFTFLGQRLRAGLVALFDVGRVWADFSPVVIGGRDVDGDGHWATGVGGGVRLVWGETLIIRADYAVSPSEGTDGLYIDLGHTF